MKNSEDNLASLETKLKKIKLVVFDIDGTLTDGTTYYSANGEELKRFSIYDGMGIVLLQKANIEIAFLTSESSGIVTARANKLNVKHLILGSKNKTEDLKKLCAILKIELDEVAYMGDDINDLHAMKLVGVSACPKGANSFIKEISTINLKKKAGKGAAREFIEMILLSNGKSITLTENW